MVTGNQKMTESLYYGLNFQTWLLIGILTYFFAILMVIYARYCFMRKTFCPFSNCCLHCTCESKFCRRTVCQFCKMEPILSKPMCCRENHTLNEPGCFTLLPSIKCQCFLPNCSYCYCFCCEMSIENEYKRTPSVMNCVQNI